MRINDFVFALHGLFLASMMYTQFFKKLWGFNVNAKDPSTHPSTPVQACCYGGVGCVACVAIVVGAGIANGNHVSELAGGWAWLDVIYALGYLKLFLTLIKFLPQIALNIQLRSTAGWSIWQILLDLYGGVASLAQLLIDAGLQGESGYWAAVFGKSCEIGVGNYCVWH